MTCTWTALITPFNDDTSVDFESLRKMLHTQNKAVNGVLLLGSTGESLQLSLDEKVQIIDQALSLELEIPLLVGLSGINHLENYALIEICNDKNIHGYLLSTPMYSKPGTEGQYHWFKKHLDMMEKPCMLYNVPGRTGVKLSFETIKRLEDHKNLWALKEASGTTEDCQRYIQENPQLEVYSGDDVMAHEHINIGAKGVVSVASNIWPERTHRYITNLLLDKEEQTSKWIEACNELFVVANPIPVKYLCHKTNLCASMQTRFPLTTTELKENNLEDLHEMIINEFGV